VKVQGSVVLPASREQVWDLLTDPTKLAKLLPGCEKLEPDGPDRYKVAIKFALAAISGKYSGSVELSEKKPPESLRMVLEGKGTPGFMRGEGRIRLAEKKGQTELRYEGEAQVGGMIAAVGQRMMDVAARRIIQQFFDAASAQLRS
jgi:hypothetical protein